MGYPRALFISDVDQEFECAICLLIVENAVQTPCDHLFCEKCLKEWINVQKVCPVDNKPLTVDVLSTPNRIVRNLLNKLEIKCDFAQDGCQKIMHLENVVDHLKKCDYNMNANVVCDQGCSLDMTRREYQQNNCFSHLANEIKKLRHELSEQKIIIDRLNEGNIKCIDKESTHDGDIENSHSHPQQEFIICDDSHVSFSGLGICQSNGTVDISVPKFIKKPNAGCSFFRSDVSLEPNKCCFKILVSSTRVTLRIGLYQKRGQTFISFSQWKHLCDRFTCKSGDVIECGIRFSQNFDFRGEFYVYLNKNLIHQQCKQFNLEDRLYPRIMILDDNQ